ncbi:MAG TPA: hypothetical protein VF815_31305 [Myxococcaceae bacterium]|jgi:hypothetical protein
MSPSYRLWLLLCLGLGLSACKKFTEPEAAAPAQAPAPSVPPVAAAPSPAPQPEPELRPEPEWLVLEEMPCEEKLAMSPSQFVARYDQSNKDFDSVKRGVLVDQYVQCYQAVTQSKSEALPAASREQLERLRKQLDSFAYQRFYLSALSAGGDARIFRRELQDVQLYQEALLRALAEGLAKAGTKQSTLEPQDFQKLDALVRECRKVPQDIIEDPYGRIFREQEKQLGELYTQLKQQLSSLPAPLAAPFVQHLSEVAGS